MKMNKSLVTRFVFATILAVAVAATGCGSDDNGGAGSGGAGSGGDGGGGGTGGTVAGPTIEMTAPSGGDPVQPGSVVTIEWTADSDVTGVDLSYTTDAAGTVSDPVMIEMDVVGSSYAWTTPTGPLFGVKIKGVATNAAGDTGEDETDDIFAVVAFSERNYVQGATCGNCHAEHNQWVFQESGHPYKLNKVDGAAPTYPNAPGVPDPPIGPPASTWDEVTYVIGGYGWKARFLGTDGFIIGTGFGDPPSGGGGNQYNFVYSPATWTNYHQTDAEPKPYDVLCGSCHTTGWVPDLDWETDMICDAASDNAGDPCEVCDAASDNAGDPCVDSSTCTNGSCLTCTNGSCIDDLTDNQDMLPGIQGTWEETGVSCEQCHGPGADHVSTQAAADIVNDRSSDLCGTCHSRPPQAPVGSDVIPASGDLPNTFIRHHEQHNEWLNSAHGDGVDPDVGCNDCHNPHIGTRYGFDDMGGIIATCESCHTEITNNAHVVDLDCVTCHMAQASKSAVPDPANLLYVGDVKTHIFSINSAAVGKDVFFNDDQSAVQSPTDGVTLDFVCYQCHQDGAGNGGSSSPRTLQQLSDRATGIHD